ncbi:hypothetical protein KFK09_009367 [Dendrobium nobile]|uniref:Ubiquitin-like domain-containing protein n=1 Tax=Dendrobium nobile TaxID=94219 RepID=A0A8T3BHA5_DENNO|nr:hypothetical protein KFK09_009367 [Dendrobium nobile]
MGSHFEIEVKPDDTVADVKKNIEASQGQSVYPADQQMLIHQGKVLKDETTLAENNVAEKAFIVIMLRKPIQIIQPISSLKSESSPKVIKNVEGKGKAIVDVVDMVTPNSLKSSEIPFDTTASTSGMKIFVKWFVNSNAIPGLCRSVINENSLKMVNNNIHSVLEKENVSD